MMYRLFWGRDLNPSLGGISFGRLRV